MSDRRQKSERRSKSERRRPARRRKNDGRSVVIELTSNDLRIVELNRGDASSQSGVDGAADAITATTIPWRVDAADLHSPEGTAELAAAFREAARLHALHAADVRLVLSGEFCVMRIVRGPMEEVRAELQQLEQRSRLYLSLGPGEKILVANTRLLDARHAHAIAAVCNKATLDALADAAEAAGFEVAVVEPGLTAISRAVGRLPDVPSEPYLLVNFNQESLEVGVCHEGQLLLDYRPGGRTRIVDLPMLLDGHLARISRHVGRCLRMAPPELNRIFLSGDGDAVDAARRQFEGHGKLEIRTVRPQDVRGAWQFQGDAERTMTAASLGAVLASYLPEADSDAPNLMEHILQRKREPLRPRLLRSAIPVAATLVIALGMTLVNYNQQRAIDEMRTELDSLSVVEGRANELRLQLTAAESKFKQLDRLAGQLPTALGGGLVRRFAQCMPSDVWLTQLELLDRRTARLKGASYQEAGVYDFVRWLEQAPGMLSVALKGTSPASSASGPTTNFELEVSLEDLAAPITKVARHE